VLRVYAGLRASHANSQIGFSKDEVKADDLHENSIHETDENTELNAKACEHVAALKLPGDVFSSPVMLDGRIFVGCRDNNLYCLQVPELHLGF
jgi:outer membrane protein assembly factor BamB